MSGSVWAAVAILGFVTLQRLLELRLADGNSRRLIANGAVEFGRGHYPFIVALHMIWLAALWWRAPGRPINLPLFGLFVLLQLGRVWVIRTLGERWTTRIIVKPGAPLVRAGPYRLLNHPNYLIVALEIAVLPLVFGLWQIAIVFSLFNAVVLAVRIRTENDALRSLRA
ncbi:MAG TPA: isoprenylcysteine carboxylmethyltransferase family protein [Sphingomicrobium sp.]|nr:isoprenylcysteine carboxylmethyltransferase family protein [Sphingomicrobium sp.]